MNKIKFLCTLVVTAMMFVFVPASSAQSIPVVAVGSSAFFAAAGLAASTSDPIRGTAPVCGARFWTGTASAVDSRASLTTPNIPNESGTVWIAWDNDTTPTTICAYLSLDNTLGQRMFFGTGASGNATLLLPTTACTTAGANKIAFVWDTATAGVPPAVYNALQGTTGTSCPAAVAPVHFNVAFGDVRAEDSQYLISNRVLCTDSNSSPFFPPDDKSCLGYGPGITAPGTKFLSSYSTAGFNVLAYAYTGTDPISGLSVPQSVQQRVGAQAFLVFVNIADTSAGGFGQLTSTATPKMTSVSSHALSALYTGQTFYTRDVYGYANASVPGVFAHALMRESLSGTYNIFESQVIRQRDGFNANSQETGLRAPTQSGYASSCFVQSATAFPTTACDNPVNFCIGSNCALRTRVIGTGQMISVGNTASLPDTIGYASWSLGNFGNKLNVKYLQLDGVDALYPGYSSADGGHDGVFPGGVSGQGTTGLLPAPAPGQCGGYFNGDNVVSTKFSCNGYTLPTFNGVQSGNYRFWNIVQAQYYGSTQQTPSFSPLNIAGFIAAAQDQAAGSTPVLNDFIPAAFCSNAACSSLAASPIQVFRSHYGVGGIAPNNGIVTPSAEAGGDMSGSVMNTQAELDSSLIGGSVLVWIQ
jgi:hypothetical protein